MNYTETLQSVDTLKALKLLGFEAEQKGAYIYFPCSCGEKGLLKPMAKKRMFFIAQNVKPADILLNWFQTL